MVCIAVGVMLIAWWSGLARLAAFSSPVSPK
jgi:hypothetical protein